MLKVERIKKSYRKGGLFSSKRQQILQDVSFICGRGECLGIIGESGSGKSTLGRLILGMEKPDHGTILLEGQPVLDRSTRLGKMSAVFQDYKSSINPFFTVEKAIMESLSLQKKTLINMDHKIDSLLSQVGLAASYRKKFPHALSGGEVQRVCIARAIATNPACIVLDEAISSLDISVQIQILNLLKELKNVYQMSYIFITHDIRAAAYLCDRVLIFRNGQMEETVEVGQLKYVQSVYGKKLLQTALAF